MDRSRVRQWHGVELPSKLDAGIAAAATTVVLIGTGLAARLQPDTGPLDAGAVALIVAVGLALAWRRRVPVVTLLSVVGLVAGYLAIGYPYGPIQLCMVFAMFEAARLSGLRTSLLAGMIAVLALVLPTVPRVLGSADTPLLLLMVWASWLIVPWALGALVRVRSAATARTREQLIARAALEERMRIASEVHDVAGHGFSAVTMQAGVALLVFDDDPAQAKLSLEAIQSTSAKALGDLRAMLDVFQRRTGADPTAGEPVRPRGLADLDALLDDVRAAGLPVRLTRVDVTPPEDVDRVAYRVIQEALTNVLRHAGPTTAEVRVGRSGDTLVVDVLDGGTGAADPSTGRGVAGMRERVEALGGELVAERRTGGGFRVSARFPFDSGATT